MAIKASSTPRAKGARKHLAPKAIPAKQADPKTVTAKIEAPAKVDAPAKPAEAKPVTPPAAAASATPPASSAAKSDALLVPPPAAAPAPKATAHAEAPKAAPAPEPAKSAPVVEKPAAAPAAAKPVDTKAAPASETSKPAVKAPASATAKVATPPKPAVAKAAPAKPAAAKPARAKAAPAKPVVAKKPEPVKAEPAKSEPAKPAIAAKTPSPAQPQPTSQRVSQPKESFMSSLPTYDFNEVFKTAFTDFQEKAKAAYEKSTAAFGDYNEFAKGNLEAVVESGKILTAGLQELGTALVADSREAFETLTSEAKSLAAAKTPTDFLQIHSDLLKKHFDKAVSFSSKQSETMLKLAGDVVAPLSSRVSVAVEKVKAAA